MARDTYVPESFVSSWIKWIMFSFNLLFWFLSWALIGIGIWAYTLTKDFNQNKGDDMPPDIFDLIFDFALLFIVFGVIVFILSFFGLLGALRENICLLKTFAICVGIVFLVELAISITVLVMATRAESALEDLLQDEAIVEYRDDINKQNVIDWFQETFECCGVGFNGWRDWEMNKYFNCSSPGFEACSVPYSCCQKEVMYKYDSEVINTRCGADTLQPILSASDVSPNIYTRGCIGAVLKFAEDNMLIVGLIAIGVVLPQIIGIGLAWTLAKQIDQQRNRYLVRESVEEAMPSEAVRERGRGRVGDANRQQKRDETFVSSWIKWLMFSFNMFFWVVSCAFIGVGIWAYYATQDYNTSSVTDDSGTDIFDILFDISLIFIAFGVVMFLLAFLGAIGSLRENTVLLKIFAAFLLIIFLTEVAVVCAVFAFSTTAKASLEELLQDELIRDYRDDINLQNIIDWFQETFECCGVGDGGWREWELNKYFNCSSQGFEACSVPYSCCREPYTFDAEIIDTRCGAGMLEHTVTKVQADSVIYTTGCVDAAIATASDKIYIIGGVGVGIVLPQLGGMFLAKVLWGQIQDQRSRWGIE
ncbi:uncharacterized protein [Watersipora subatra]|uniref:uncharacterized protein n=1 Tax=Watersipora subatra TaxID=2589382 RepID=UPI00355BD412